MTIPAVEDVLAPPTPPVMDCPVETYPVTSMLPAPIRTKGSEVPLVETPFNIIVMRFTQLGMLVKSTAVCVVSVTAVDCTIMRPRKDIMLPQFLVSSTQTSGYREQVRAKITGTTRDRISRSNLAEVQIPVPPLEEQKRIVARLDSMRAKTSEMVAAYDAKLTAAKNLRQSILEAAFAGAL